MSAGVILETPRLALRELRDSDFERIHAYASNHEVVRYLDWGPSSVADTTQFWPSRATPARRPLARSTTWSSPYERTTAWSEAAG